jgi:protein-S-isoprenylcysteine O-methyltransferase Ste14
MNQQIFKYLYLIGMLGTYMVRASGVMTAARGAKKEDILTAKQKIQGEGILITIVMLLWFLSSQVLPILYTVTGWFSFAEISRPDWLGFTGFAILIFGNWMLWKAHKDLGRHWSSTVQIKSEQALVTQGIYQVLRHPIYTAHILWGLAQALMLPNWLAGWMSLPLIILVFVLRIPNEERMMVEQFGDEYRNYMENTGGLFPKIK